MRVDNSIVIDFLTSTASTLIELDKLEHKIADDLRLDLRSANSFLKKNTASPLLIALEQQDAIFLSVLEARYGKNGYCLNLLRYSLRLPVTAIIETVNSFAASLLKKIDLLLNRPFLVELNGSLEKHTPYAAILIDFLDALQDITATIINSQKSLFIMNGHAMALERQDDIDTDLAVAKNLGFLRVLYPNKVGQEETKLKKNLSLALLQLTNQLSNLIEQITKPNTAQLFYNIYIECETLRAECHKLDQFDIPISGNITIQEIRRQAIIDTLSNIEGLLKSTFANTQELIGHSENHAAPADTQALLRRITYELIRDGVSPRLAHEAGTAFTRYLRTNNLQPSEIIVGELTRIHPNLTAQCLELTVSIEQGTSLMKYATLAKESILERAKQLAQFFVPSLLLFLTIFSSCGLKTYPASDKTEVRPEIPFKTSMYSPPAKKELSHVR